MTFFLIFVSANAYREFLEQTSEVGCTDTTETALGQWVRNLGLKPPQQRNYYPKNKKSSEEKNSICVISSSLPSFFLILQVSKIIYHGIIINNFHRLCSHKHFLTNSFSWIRSYCFENLVSPVISKQTVLLKSQQLEPC